MNTNETLERMVTDRLASDAAGYDSDRALVDALASTSRMRPYPQWLALIKEPPMRIPSRVVVGSPTFRLATILALTLALALALAGAVAGAASLLPTEPVPAPFGPARNGSLVFEQDGDIYLADADGSNPRAIITGDTNDWSPWFSHDGRTIAFARGPEPGYQGMLADADGTNIRQLVDVADEWNVEFMPDDTEMVGTRLVDGKHVLSMIDLASGAIRDLDVGDLDPSYFQMPRPPDGDEIVFTAYLTPGGPEEGLYAIKTDGTGLRTIGTSYANEPIDGSSLAPPASFIDPTLSPDGTTIAYWNWEPGQATGAGGMCGTCLHLRDLSSGNDLPLRFDPTEGGLKLKFSPDGTHVVFEGTTDGGASQHLVYTPLDGSGSSVQIGPSYGNASRSGFDFSPDGTRVILALKSGSTIIDLAMGETTQVPDIRTNPYWQRLAS